MSDHVKEILRQPSEALPLYLRSFRLEIVYNDGAAPDAERRQVLEAAFAELKDALRLGFFCGERFSARATTNIGISWSDRGDMSVTVSADGIHYNALVAAVRIAVRLHHTSREGYEAMRAILGDDADVLSPPVSLRENIANLAIVDVMGTGRDGVATTDVLNYTSEGMGLPAYTPLQGDIAENYEGDRLVITSRASGAFRADDLDDIEDCFLRLFGSGVFTSLDDLDCEVSDDEAEIFTRGSDGRVELLFGNYRDQKYGMIEFLNVVSAGNMMSLTIRRE